MDACRAIAATVVVLNHARDLLLQDYAGDLVSLPFYFLGGLGHAGVIVFFVLSGFWITKAVDSRRDQSRFWTTYLIDRASRLGIVLLPVLAIGGVLDRVGVQQGWPLYDGLIGAHSLDGGTAERLSVPVLLANVTSFQGLALPTWGTNGPLWSLAYEWWFYIWFPALAFSVWRRRPSPALLLLGVGLVYPELFVGFLSWLAGSLLYAGVRHRHAWHALVERHSALSLIGSISLLTVALIRQRLVPGGVGDVGVAVAFALMLLALCLTDPAIWRVMRPVARYGAQSSYSLYAIHFPVLALIVAPIVGSQRLRSTPGHWLLIIALIVTLVVVGWMLSHITERHTGRLRGRLKRLAGIG